MRKFILLLATVYIAAASAVSAFVITSAALAGALLPIIEPIAQAMISGAADEIQKVVIEGKCPLNCRKALPVSCGTEAGLSTCKKVCQKIYQLGGYEIKVRFGEDWSLAECVRKRVLSGKNTPQGKGNTKSIAIYSQKDLDDLLNLIALQMAARQIVDTKGTQLGDKQLKKAKTTREKVLEEAQSLMGHITESINKNVREGVYGNQ